VKYKKNFIDAIGNTPLIRLNTYSDETGCEILGKAEFMNPGGSVKDRAAKAIILNAEKAGLLKPGGTVVEGTAGNTGIGLAHVCNSRGYQLIIVIPETQSKEKLDLLASLGAMSEPFQRYRMPIRTISRNERDAWHRNWIMPFGPTSLIILRTDRHIMKLQAQKFGLIPMVRSMHLSAPQERVERLVAHLVFSNRKNLLYIPYWLIQPVLQPGISSSMVRSKWLAVGQSVRV